MRTMTALLGALTFAAPAGLPGAFGIEPLQAQAAAPSPGAVLVTGASSGIGRQITELLASQGRFVYAGARSAEDIAALSRIPNVQGVRLDVTRQAEIDAVVQLVERAGRGLHGVVNNAGVAILSPMIETPEEDMLFQFDVNVLGPYRVTRAFAPVLIASKGRVVTIGSINGIIAGPFSGPYAMSKHAVEGFTDALALEMAGLGVRVSIVEPGRFRSDMSANVLRRTQEKNRTASGSRFEAQYQQLLNSFGGDESRYEEPVAVAQAVAHALFDPDPKRRYLVAPVAAQAHATIRRSLERAVELNEKQRFSLSRDSMVAMLDVILAARR